MGGAVSQITTPLGYPDTAAALFGACFITSGLIGAPVFSVYLDKTHKYKKTF